MRDAGVSPELRPDAVRQRSLQMPEKRQTKPTGAAASPDVGSRDALEDAVMQVAEWELKQSPSTYYDYEPHKLLRYCGRARWASVMDSAYKALVGFTQEWSGLNRVMGARTKKAQLKAWAVFCAKVDGDLKGISPDELRLAVQEGQWAFLQDLHNVCGDEFTPTVKNGWGYIVIRAWCDPLPIKGLWPFAFWADEALVAFLKMVGVDITVDQLRKFRRAWALQRPPVVIVRDWNLAYSGTIGDGIERTVIGGSPVRKARRLPQKGR